MVVYKVELLPSAKRQLAHLPKDAQRRIARKIDILQSNPRPHGVKVLHGGQALLRLRVGDYRVIYRLEQERLLILVIKIGHRADIYRNL